jgi:transcription initiation factor TFIID subunit 13
MTAPSDKVLTITTIRGPAPPPNPSPTAPEQKFQFQEEISNLLYGFGDDPNPDPESVQLVECYLVEFINDLLNKATNRSIRRGAGNKVQLQDVLHYIRDNPKMYNRVRKLLKLEGEFDQTKREWLEDNKTPKNRDGIL